MITFVDFELENTWDFFSVGLGDDAMNRSTTFAHFTGAYAPHTVTSDRYATLWMFFDADGKYTRRGFHLTIMWQNESSEYNFLLVISFITKRLLSKLSLQTTEMSP